MKTRTFYTIIISISVFLFGSCKKKDLDMYNAETNGNAIYFSAPFATALEDKPQDSTHVRFSFLDENVTSTEVIIPVSATGPFSNVDREFTIEAEPNSALKAGVHYKFKQQKLVIPANKLSGNIELEILKTTDMKTAILNTRFNLVENGNFNTAIKSRKTANARGEISILSYRLMVDNINSAPYCWVSTETGEMFNDYLGDYSAAKLNLIIKLFDEDKVHFTDPHFTKANYFTYPKLNFWASYLKYWLGKEATEGRIHTDENNKVITVGRYAQ